jgi:hypothetical protein
MPNERSAQNLFDQIHNLWIEPEISRRNQKKLLPENFKIYRCLIKLPKGQSPIVEFNDEVKWLAQVKMEPGITLTSGRPVFLHEIQEISSVSLPEINGERVAFVYLFWDGHAYRSVLDFKPNLIEEIPSSEHMNERDIHLNKAIAESLQAILVEKAIHIHDSHQEQLREIGLWASPALLPYPLSKILKQLGENDLTNARNTLVAYCDSQFIDGLASKWWTLKQFNLRKKLLMNALDAHKIDKFDLSIYALSPQIEGIATDWLYEKLPNGKIPPNIQKRIKEFRNLGILEKKTSTFSDRRIGESVIEIILESVLQNFEWREPVDKSIPGRHVIGHGKYDESMLTEENSIKLFLLLDTIYYIISKYSDEIIDTYSSKASDAWKN